MLYGNIKKALRLNRTIGVCFLFYAAFTTAAAAYHHQWQLANQWPTLLWVLFTVGLIVASELGRNTLKKFAEAEGLPLEKVSIALPVSLFFFTTASYLLSGNVWVYAYGVFPLLTAQLFGHYQLSRLLLTTQLLLLLATLPLGYPSPLPLVGWSNLVLAVPLLVTTFHYGAFIASLVRTASSQVSRLQSLAATDGLTGLINRRQFNHRLQAELARARRHHAPLSLALFDIDNFKKINDVYGHPIGDRILKELGNLLHENIRESDVPARYGGEEFALILPETRQVEAFELLERLRSMVERTVFCLPDNPMTITISIGLAQLDLKNHTPYALVEQADAALYEAKHQGKNRVVYGVLPTPKINIHRPKPPAPPTDELASANQQARGSASPSSLQQLDLPDVSGYRSRTADRRKDRTVQWESTPPLYR